MLAAALRPLLSSMFLSSVFLYAAASSDSVDWLQFPGGRLVHSSCAHKSTSAHSEPLPPCRRLRSTGQLPPHSAYYGGWSVFAFLPANRSLSHMSATFTVPPKPTSLGPLGLSSLYVFPGLEDTNRSFILQPVLQIGRSGCVVDPLLYHNWHFTSYFVDSAGRAKCGPVLRVEEGDEIQGNMTADPDGRSWNISVRTPLHFASMTATPPAPVTNAFLTIETIVNYNCQLFPAPPSSQVLFHSVQLLDDSGSSVSLNWQPQVKHHECQQDVAVYDGGASVALMFNSSIKNV